MSQTRRIRGSESTAELSRIGVAGAGSLVVGFLFVGLFWFFFMKLCIIWSVLVVVVASFTISFVCCGVLVFSTGT